MFNFNNKSLNAAAGFEHFNFDNIVAFQFINACAVSFVIFTENGEFHFSVAVQISNSRNFKTIRRAEFDVFLTYSSEIIIFLPFRQPLFSTEQMNNHSLGRSVQFFRRRSWRLKNFVRAVAVEVNFYGLFDNGFGARQAF